MSTIIRIAQKSDLDLVLNFERALVQQSDLSDEDKIFTEWTSFWRKESLEHYLPCGWSFIAHSPDGQLEGYFLGQALLFFAGQTQSLWIEHLNAKNQEVRQQLLDTAIRLSREKHLQRVYLPNKFRDQFQAGTLSNYKFEDWHSEKIFIKTTRSAT